MYISRAKKHSVALYFTVVCIVLFTSQKMTLLSMIIMGSAFFLTIQLRKWDDWFLGGGLFLWIIHPELSTTLKLVWGGGAGVVFVLGDTLKKAPKYIMNVYKINRFVNTTKCDILPTINDGASKQQN